MIKPLSLLVLFAALTTCEGLYDDDDGGMPAIRTQADVAAYNATVVAANDKLVCTRERVIGSNIRQFVCMTAAQQARMQEEARQDAAFLSGTLDIGAGGNIAQ